MKDDSKYISDQLQRMLKVITMMAGHEVHGVSPSSLANLAQTSPANITRILANLKLAEFAERLPSDNTRWRLTPKLIRIANIVTLNFSTAEQQLQQDQHNYSRLAI